MKAHLIRHHLECSVYGLLFAVATSVTIPANAAEPATKNLGQLIDGMQAMSQRFLPERPYRIQFRQEREGFDNTGKSNFHDKLVVDHARLGDQIYVKSKLDEGFDERIYWRDNICVQIKSTTVYFWPYLISQGFNQNHYTHCLFIDTYRGLEWGSAVAAQGRRKNQSEDYFYMLPRMIDEHRDKYNVRPELESVDGSLCHVVEWPGRDLIRIDVEHGFVPRNRRLSYNKDLPAAEWENRDLFEVQPGFWLPKKQEERFLFIAPKADVNKLRQKVKRELISASFAPLDAGMFEPQFPEKNRPTVVIDSVRGFSYRKYPEGVDPLTQIIYDVRSAVDTSHRNSPKLLIINGIALGIISLLLLRKHHNSRRQ